MRRIADERYEPNVRQAVPELHLMIVDGFVVDAEARHDHWLLPVDQAREHRSRARVGYDDTSAPYVVDEDLIGHRTETDGARGAASTRAALNDDWLPEVNRLERPKQPVERKTGADCDEDHASEITAPTYRAFGSVAVSSGHCTYRRSANGATSLQLSEARLIRLRLSMYTNRTPKNRASQAKGTATAAPVVTMTAGRTRRNVLHASKSVRTSPVTLLAVGQET